MKSESIIFVIVSILLFSIGWRCGMEDSKYGERYYFNKALSERNKDIYKNPLVIESINNLIVIEAIDKLTKNYEMHLRKQKD